MFETPGVEGVELLMRMAVKLITVVDFVLDDDFIAQRENKSKEKASPRETYLERIFK